MGEQQTAKCRRKGKAGRVIRRMVKIIVVLAILAVAALFGLRAYISSQAESSSSAGYSSSAVRRGSIMQTVYGTGTTSARSQPNILAGVDGTLTELRVEIGDTVKAGDILAVITNDELDDTITDLEFALWELDDKITDTAAGSKVTSIEAPAAGRVMAIYAQAGDDALAVFRREGSLAIISTDGRMKVEFDSALSSMDIALGDTVCIVGRGVDTVGTVTDLTRQGTHATVTILSDELPMGTAVTVSTQAGEELGTGTLEVNKPLAVSSYGGTIKKVSVAVGDTVKRKQTIFQLEDSPLTLTLEDLRLQREAAAKELADAKEQRESLIVVAPCDGVVASLNVSEGDDVSSGTLLGSILEGEDMNLTIAVDELDVVQVEAGQSVTITVDALSGAELSGEVYRIAPVGTNSGGVTTYDVELTFDAAGTGVRSGMNATGEIEVASAQDALYVPVEALMTIANETYLMVADGGTQSLTNAVASVKSSKRGASQTADTAQAGGSGASAQQGVGVPADMPEGEMPGDGMPEGGMAGGGITGGTMPGADAGGSGSGRSTRGNAEQTDAQTESTQSAAAQPEQQASWLERVRSSLHAWLYEGVSTAEEVTGSLVRVETGLQNDDYVQILSGVSEGDVVLYTASQTSSTANGFSSGSRGGSSGMGGGMMGFGF